MTTTDLSRRTPAHVARKRPANAVTSANNVIDGTARPTRSVSRQAIKFLMLLVPALLLLGFLMSSISYMPS